MLNIDNELLENLNSSASDEEIYNVESIIKSKLPQDLIDLLKIHNGCINESTLTS